MTEPTIGKLYRVRLGINSGLLTGQISLLLGVEKPQYYFDKPTYKMTFLIGDRIGVQAFYIHNWDYWMEELQ